MTKSPVKHHKWTFNEDKAFTEFISIAKTNPKYGQCTTSVPEWPGYKEKNSFWSDGAKQIQCSTGSNILLTNSRLTSRVYNSYRKRFVSLEDAESPFGLSISDSLAELVIDNRKDHSTKTRKPVNVESETYNQTASQCELPQPESGLPEPETPQPADIAQSLPTLESVLKLASHLGSNEDLSLLQKCTMLITIQDIIESNYEAKHRCISQCRLPSKAIIMHVLNFIDTSSVLHYFRLHHSIY